MCDFVLKLFRVFYILDLLFVYLMEGIKINVGICEC